MKRLMAFSLIALPYLMVLGVALSIALTDSSFFGADTPVDYVFIAVSVFSVASTVFVIVISIKKESGIRLLFWARLIKLCHIPYYLLTFAFGIVSMMLVIGPMIAMMLLLINVFMLFTSSAYSVCGLIRACREGRIKKQLAFKCVIAQLFFCADVFTIVSAYNRVKLTPQTFFPDKKPNELQFAVIAARFEDKWIYVRHRERTTFEIPGGHIEPGESAQDAAARELREETGAEEFTLTHVCDYGVSRGKSTTYGALYIAEVTTLGDTIPDEKMVERIFCETPPENQTYPLIQPLLFECVTSFLNQAHQPSIF